MHQEESRKIMAGDAVGAPINMQEKIIIRYFISDADDVFFV